MRIVGGTTDVVNLTSLIVVYGNRVTHERLELEGASYYGVKVDDYYGPVPGVALRGLYVHHTGRDGLKIQKADGLVIEDCEMAFTGMRFTRSLAFSATVVLFGVRRSFTNPAGRIELPADSGGNLAAQHVHHFDRPGGSD